MNSLKEWLQDHLGLTRMLLLLFVGLNLFSVHQVFSISLILVLAHIFVAVSLLLGAILIR